MLGLPSRSALALLSALTIMSVRAVRVFVSVLLAAVLGGCAAHVEYIPGTKVPNSNENQTLIGRVEEYRLAVERKDSAALLLMASKHYWEDAGTQTGADDYGYQGLVKVLGGRFQKVDSIRYSMRYMNIERHGGRAFVDVLIDASFSHKNAQGQDVRSDMRDQNRFVLEWDGKKWMFLSGM